jgi:hypothetical protein
LSAVAVAVGAAAPSTSAAATSAPAAKVCDDFDATSRDAPRAVVDTSGTWNAATCTVHLTGGKRRGRAWVYSVSVLPHIMPGGVGVCSGLWPGPASDGLDVTCVGPDDPVPTDIDVRTVVAPRRGEAVDRFLVATGPSDVVRIEVETTAGAIELAGRRPGGSWQHHYFVARLPTSAAVQAIRALGVGDEVIGRTESVVAVPIDDLPSPNARSFAGQPNVVLTVAPHRVFARISLDR